MDNIQEYLDDLKDTNPDVRKRATSELWALWYRQAGEIAESQLMEGNHLMGENQYEEAESVFSDLINQFPDFPEGHNKLATVLYLQGKFKQSVTACKMTLEKNPHHFGAWNGMGMCLYKLARYDEAIKSFQMAMAIQPYASINRGYIARCRGKLN
jgi:tetratricopeptide (TPR) repeat protein